MRALALSLVALALSCSAAESPVLGARYACGGVSRTCFGVVHDSIYVTADSRERAVATVLRSYAGARIDETYADRTVTFIKAGDTTILVYAPESGSDWLHANCSLDSSEHTIIDVAWKRVE
jgi:hypothetical protein